MTAERVRYRACGCRADQPCDEEKHLRNAIRAADAMCWSLHEAEVDRHG